MEFTRFRLSLSDMFARTFSYGLMACLLSCSVAAQPAIGNWREHLPYYQARRVAAIGSKIFCATPYSMFTVNPADNSIERFSRVNGLSETGISAMEADGQTGKLLIAYTNSNLDILDRNSIKPVNAIKLKNIAGDKTVYNIFFYQNKAYLSSGIGIIVADEAKYEISDTYIISFNGLAARVNAVAADGQYFYAATTEGLKRAPVAGVNLADFRNWQLLSGTAGLPAGACEQVLNVQNRIIVQKGDSLFTLTNGSAALFFTSSWSNTAVNTSSGQVLLSQRMASGQARVVVLNADGSLFRIIQQPGTVTDPQQAIVVQGDCWIADMSTGLVQAGSSFRRYQPASPLSIATGDITVQDNSLWIAAGTVTADWKSTFSKNGVYRFTGNEWTNYNAASYPAFDSLYDIIAIAASAVDQSVWAGSFGGGLLQLKADNTLAVFKSGFIEPSQTDPQRYQVGGLCFDAVNNLWITNYGADHPLAVRKADGSWRRFAIPFSTNNAVAQILTDDNNQQWIVSPNGNGLFCFNYGASIDNTADDQWKYYRTGPGIGNLPDNNVLCIDKDRNGFIWVGTKKGIGIIQCPGQVFSAQGCDALLPVVQQDNFAGYLFSSEEVQTITTDGADRKWIGTRNGAWLISPDGDKTLYHFTQDNSPLLSNDVKKIAIDPTSGEVFFSTANGICSYRSTATQGTITYGNVLVFPNPVPPAYTGTIAIRGLVNNAIVKITELDGRLVYQTRANGGQATWNGFDYKGRRISSGVYLVLASDETRKENIVTKIVFIR